MRTVRPLAKAQRTRDRVFSPLAMPLFVKDNHVAIIKSASPGEIM